MANCACLACSPPCLQDELFNLTTDEIRATALRSQLDMHVSGCSSIQTSGTAQQGQLARCQLWPCPPAYTCSTLVHPTPACPSAPPLAPPCPPLPVAQVEGSIQKVQLDNQMLDAVQPVVLAPAVEYKPSGVCRGQAGMAGSCTACSWRGGGHVERHVAPLFTAVSCWALSP